MEDAKWCIEDNFIVDPLSVRVYYYTNNGLLKKKPSNHFR